MKSIVIVLLALTGACQPAFINGVPNENSPYFDVPVDSRLLLRSALTVPAREGSAYFQNGRTMPWHEVSIYSTWCVLQLEARRETAQTIEPDAFIVRQVSNERRYHLAADTRVARDFDRDDGETYEVMATVMQLESPRQPQVRRLVCADWGLPQGGYYLTVAKIRRTLGDHISLELPPPSR
jgi:hypothetical protein